MRHFLLPQNLQKECRMNSPLDYLLIGHIAADVTPNGFRLGGTVSYAAHTAVAFGLRVGILTSAAPNEPLLAELPPQVTVLSVPAEHTTTFDNRYDGSQRTQYLYHRAETLSLDMLPPAWQQTPLVHIGPIAYETDPALVAAFSSSRVCVTPQGWMRRIDSDNRVQWIPWAAAETVLPRVTLAVLSEEDIRRDAEVEAQFARQSKVLVVTRAEQGGTVYRDGQPWNFNAEPAEQLDPTGAGDVFATSLHIAWSRTGNMERAVRIAARLAAHSVTRIGFAGAPTPTEIEAAFSA